MFDPKCDFCGESLTNGQHPMTESGSRDVTRCQVSFLLRRTSELEQKNRELHRRCQIAEGAVLRKVKAEQAAGAPLAKRLAIAGYEACEHRINEAVRWITTESLGTPQERATRAVAILNGYETTGDSNG